LRATRPRFTFGWAKAGGGKRFDDTAFLSNGLGAGDVTAGSADILLPFATGEPHVGIEAFEAFLRGVRPVRKPA
jgi:hypothetical protein